MGDTCPDPVHTQCDAVAATALYTKPPVRSNFEPEDKTEYIMALERSQAVYTMLAPIADTTLVDDKVERPPQIIVQVRKRQGKVALFLDGFCSEGNENPEGGKEHLLYWHSGLHEDKNTQCRVFSPVAIVCAIEDGQRPIRGVRVGVWQTFLDAAGRAIHKSM